MGMQSLKSETDSLYASIANYDSITKEANGRNDQHEADIRDLGKKIQGAEVEFDETNDKLTKALETLEEKEKNLKLSLRRETKTCERLPRWPVTMSKSLMSSQGSLEFKRMSARGRLSVLNWLRASSRMLNRNWRLLVKT